MTDLHKRLSDATEGARELDALMAVELLGWSVWKSKHGYWNVTGPDGNTFSHGSYPEGEFDPFTGAKLPDPEAPMTWADDAGLPPYTASLDAALALASRVLPGVQLAIYTEWAMTEGEPQDADGSWTITDETPRGCWVRSYGGVERNMSACAATPALALCIAILSAKATEADQ